MLEEEPNAELIEKMTLAVYREKHTIDSLSIKFQEPFDKVKKIVEETFMAGGFAEYEGQEKIIHLTIEGITSARFIELAELGDKRPKYYVEIPNNKINLYHKRILEILKLTTKENPIEIMAKYCELFPEDQITGKKFRYYVHELEDGGYISVDLEDRNYITNRGLVLLEQI